MADCNLFNLHKPDPEKSLQEIISVVFLAILDRNCSGKIVIWCATVTCLATAFVKNGKPFSRAPCEKARLKTLLKH